MIYIPGMDPALVALLTVVAIWDLIWKGIALWKCGRNNQLNWFIIILVLNTVGILPIIYLLFFQKRNIAMIPKVNAVKQTVKKKSKKRKR